MKLKKVISGILASTMLLSVASFSSFAAAGAAPTVKTYTKVWSSPDFAKTELKNEQFIVGLSTDDAVKSKEYGLEYYSASGANGTWALEKDGTGDSDPTVIKLTPKKAYEHFRVGSKDYSGDGFKPTAGKEYRVVVTAKTDDEDGATLQAKYSKNAAGAANGDMSYAEGELTDKYSDVEFTYTFNGNIVQYSVNAPLTIGAKDDLAAEKSIFVKSIAIYEVGVADVIATDATETSNLAVGFNDYGANIDTKLAGIVEGETYMMKINVTSGGAAGFRVRWSTDNNNAYNDAGATPAHSTDAATALTGGNGADTVFQVPAYFMNVMKENDTKTFFVQFTAGADIENLDPLFTDTIHIRGQQGGNIKVNYVVIYDKEGKVIEGTAPLNISVDPATASVETSKTVEVTAKIDFSEKLAEGAAKEEYNVKDIKWTVDKETIATVKADEADPTKAVVTGVAEGKAKITATLNGKSSTCTVTVTNGVPATGGDTDNTTGISEGKITEELEKDKPVITAAKTDKVSKEQIKNIVETIKDTNKVVTLDLSSYKVLIDPAKVKNADLSKLADLDLDMGIKAGEKDAPIVKDSTVKLSSSLVISPKTTGEFGITVTIAIPKADLAAANVDTSKPMYVYYIDDKNKITALGEFKMTGDEFCIDISHASSYVISNDNVQIDSDGNPKTGVPFAAVPAVAAGAAVLAALVIKKKTAK